ncbi:MAG: ABC transporter permease subunit [Thermoplasmatota archaeon]
MKGRMALMELRSGWKGLAMFGVLVLLVSAGMPQILPAYRDSFTEDLEGASRVTIEVPEQQGAMINLSWEPDVNTTAYVVLEDNSSAFLTSRIQYFGNETNISFAKTFEEKRYYAVMAIYTNVTNASWMDLLSAQRELVGIAATGTPDNPFEELLDNPAYQGFSRGRAINPLEIKGFIILEFFSWWWMLAGLFIAYLSVSVIAGDFENRRMDIFLSTPTSRRQYILEKFLSLALIALYVIGVATVGLIVGVAGLGALDELPAHAVFLSLFGCFPFLLVIAAVGILSAVAFQKVKVGMGVTFAVVFAQFFLYTFGNYTPALSWMKTISIFNYWDYAAPLLDDVFKLGDFAILAVVAGVILAAGLWLFDRKDVPA